MLIVYGVNRKTILRKAAKDTHHREESYREIFQVLFLMVTPVIFTTFIYNCNAYLDNYLFFTILGWHGENQKALNAAYGEFSNYYVTLINVPLAMASASASAMMPEVSSCYATGDLDEANDKILETIRLTVHLKFLAARILRHTPWQDAGLESMYTVLLQRDSRNEVCLQRINAYLWQEFDYELDHQEQVYLLIHLTKIVG